MTPVRVAPEALVDAEAAAAHYEAASPDLGLEFLLELDETIRRISLHPKGYQAIYKEVRRAPLHRFPYGVFYVLESGEAVVFAVGHLSRDPEAWKGRAP